MLIDSHCHLDDDRFDDDRHDMMERARAVGIRQFVIPATTLQRWHKVRAVADEFAGVYPAYGLHPMFMDHHQLAHVAALDAWLDENPAIAVGECGVDFYMSTDNANDQLELLRAQLDVAANHQLPVILHVRKGMDIVLRELRQARVARGVVHSFSGSLQQAQQLIEMDFKLGIAATVSFERARKLREIVSSIDLSALLIESDAPDQSGEGHRGQRNEPAFILDHLATMAELRKMPVNKLGTQLASNTQKLFALS